MLQFYHLVTLFDVLSFSSSSSIWSSLWITWAASEKVQARGWVHRNRKSHCRPCWSQYLSSGKATNYKTVSAMPDPCMPKTCRALREDQNQQNLPETVPCREQKESTTLEEQVIRTMSLYSIALISYLISSWSSEERKISVMLANRFYCPRRAASN